MSKLYDPDSLKALSEEYLPQYAKTYFTGGKREGAVIKYLCPFHNEKTPSFVVYPAEGQFHCYGCGAHGDLFDLIGEYEDIADFQGRVKRAEEFSGTVIDQVEMDPSQTAPKEDIPDLKDAPKINFTPEVQEAHANLLQAPAAMQHYQKRGFTTDIINRFMLGYDERGYNHLLRMHAGNQMNGSAARYYRYVLPYMNPSGTCTYMSFETFDRDADVSKYVKLTHGKTGIAAELFNEWYLYQDTPEVIFVCEGIFDAISVEQSGGHAIALVGTAEKRFLSICKMQKPQTVFVIGTDNDNAGRKAAKKIKTGLDSLGIQYMVKTAPTGKDFNDALLADPIALQQFVIDTIQEGTQILKSTQKPEEVPQEAIETPQEAIETVLQATDDKNTAEVQEAPQTATESPETPDKTIDEAADQALQETAEQYKNDTALIRYMDTFRDLIEDSKTKPPISTGFGSLDRVFDDGLYKGETYYIGAESSAGKTAVCIQIADQIAAAGTDVLFISIEMSKKQLVARSVSRLTAILSKEKYGTIEKVARIKNGKDIYMAKSSHDITGGHRYADYTSEEVQIIDAAIQRYTDTIAPHMYIAEGRGLVTIKDIRDLIQRHCMLTGRTPVIMIDYLQIIAPPQDVALTERQSADLCVSNLKQIAGQYDTPLICISSFNRQSYNTPVTMKAFKESGGIEYGADNLVGLQLQGVGTEGFDAEKAANEFPRKVELKLIKGRESEHYARARFAYYAKYNYFRQIQP